MFLKFKKKIYKPKCDKLEIGPGTERIPGFCTINIEKSPITDYIANISHGFPFPDNSFAVVYASHIFEHLVWYKQDEIMSDLFRIVKPGGHVDIWVPNALKIAKAFVDAEERGSRDFENDGWYKFNPEHDPSIWFNGRIFSYGDGFGTPGHFQFHSTAFSPRLLKEKLLKAGFANVEELPHSEILGHDHGWINLGMRAYKD